MRSARRPEKSTCGTCSTPEQIVFRACFALAEDGTFGSKLGVAACAGGGSHQGQAGTASSVPEEL
jgi:hypothetical protein